MRGILRAVFSRYAISAVMIILEVALMTYLFVSASGSAYIVVALSLAVSLFAFVNIVIKDTNPEYKITWVALILMLPPFGAIIYFIFYQRRMSGREIRLLRGVIGEMNSRDSRGANYRELRDESALAAGKAQAILSDDAVADIYTDTRSLYFGSGEELFDSLIADLRSAKQYIFLEYFIFALQNRGAKFFSKDILFFVGFFAFLGKHGNLHAHGRKRKGSNLYS